MTGKPFEKVMAGVFGWELLTAGNDDDEGRCRTVPAWRRSIMESDIPTLHRLWLSSFPFDCVSDFDRQMDFMGAFGRA